VSAGRDAVANARWGSTGLPERTTGCGAVGVSSLDFFAGDWCGISAHRSGEKLERSSSSHRPLRLVGTGCGAAGVSSLDFFAGDWCGSSLLTEVAKNSNAPRAPTDPSASSVGTESPCVSVLRREVGSGGLALSVVVAVDFVFAGVERVHA